MSTTSESFNRAVSNVSLADTVTIPLPPKTKLSFPIDLDTVGVGFQPLVYNIKQVAEETLYDWTDFPIVLPSSAFCDDTEKRKAKLNTPLFKAPDFDELSEVAHDEYGNLRYLTPPQLQQLHHYGQFDVDSIKFPGEKHTWRLNRFIQKGTVNTLKRFWLDISWAARFLFEWGRNRLVSKRVSVLSGLRNIAESLVIILDLFIGIPHTNHGDMERKLEEERRHYLICELSVKPKKLVYLEEYWEQYEALMFVSGDERNIEQLPIESLRLPPYRFITPGKLPIDLRLHNSVLQERCFSAISEIDQVIREDWFQQFKDNRVATLREQGKRQSKIREIIQEEAPREYLKVLFEAMRQSEKLTAVEPTIIEPLIDLARYNALLYSVKQDLDKEYRLQQEQFLSDLRTQHPVMFEVGPWNKRQQRLFEESFHKKREFSLHDRLHERLIQEHLDQYAYFIQRDKDFIATRRPLLQKALLKKTYPDGQFHISFRAVFPRCWQVLYRDNGETYRVDLRIVSPQEGEMELARERSVAAPKCSRQYTLCKKVTYHSNTSWPFWRWRHFLIFTYVWILRLMQLFLISVPFGSAVSYSALFRIRNFYPHYKFNSFNGHLYPDLSKPCRTLCSRLRGLWHHVLKSRRHFETKPMTGLLDKSLVRHFHRLWCYGIQGCCGTILIIVVMPPLCLVVSTISLLLGITAPLWFFILSVLLHLGIILFYDVHKKGSFLQSFCPLFEAVLCRLLIRGICMIIMCLLLSFTLLPLLALLCSIAAVVRYSIRYTWDALLFYSVLRRKARVPVGDDFVARRISGPGLLSNYCYQAHIDQALLALLIELEKTELDLWNSQYEQIAKMPENNYKDFAKVNFAAFSLGLLRMGRYQELMERQRLWLEKLTKEDSTRRTLLNQLLTLRDLRKVKLTSKDLNTLMDLAEKIVCEFYSKRILQRLSQLNVDEKHWWQKEHRLGVHDYSGYAATIFTKIFGEQFFVSLEESTKVFQLEVDHLDMESYMDMLETSVYRLDLDQVTPILRHDESSMENAKIGFHRHCYMYIEMPTLQASYFQPLSLCNLPLGSLNDQNTTFYSRKRWNKVSCLNCWKTPSTRRWIAEVNLYHPAIIALLIHKRERESINLDISAYWVQCLVQRIIKISLVPSSESEQPNEGNATSENHIQDAQQIEAEPVLTVDEFRENRREEMLMVTEEEDTTMTSEEEASTPT